ncbi:MAG TPA: hypothetical protein VGN63_05310 [Flavisolibacter sp.]|jgi:hypothetical protein|nr:hypothetical protein [Flavisolibacter sp.]
MRLLYVDYQALVLEFCNRKRQDRTSSALLRSATPASLRRECLQVYKERKARGEKEEKNTLKDFFGQPPEGKDFGHLIKNCHTDRFKPLQNLINGKTKTSDSTNVELLAWLIDYPHRPFVAGMELEGKEESNGGVAGQVKETQNPDTHNKIGHSQEKQGKNTEEGEASSNPQKLVSTQKKPVTRRTVTMATLLVTAILLTGFIAWQQNRMQQLAFLNASYGCMYWTGDHYEETPCQEERKDRLKFPMDLQKMKNFKRILREDTITERSIGNIYYIKINGNIEYYTSGGKHPVDVTRTLHKLSAYMFNKYLRREETAKE